MDRPIRFLQPRSSAQLLGAIILLALFTYCYALVNSLLVPRLGNNVSVPLIGIFLCCGLLLMLRAGYEALVGRLFVIGMAAVLVVAVFLVDRSMLSMSMIGFFAIIPLAGLLVSRRLENLVIVAAFVTLFGSYFAEQAGLIVPAIGLTSTPRQVVVFAVILGFATWFQRQLVQRLTEAAEAQAAVNAELQASQQELERVRLELEERVLERTAELEGVNQQLRSEAAQRVQITQQVHERERHLKRYNEALTKLTQSKAIAMGNLEIALREITETSANALGVDRVSVWFYDDQRTKIFCSDLFLPAADTHWDGFELAVQDYPAFFEALEENRTIAAFDAHSDPRTKEFSTPYLKDLDVKSMLEAPLRMRNRVIGVMCNESVGETRHWTLEEQNFVGSISDFVVLALEAHQRHLAEENLERERQQLAQIIAAVPGAVLITNQHFPLRVLWANDPARELLGWDENHLFDDDIRDRFFHNYDYQRLLSLLDKEAHVNGEILRLLDVDDELFWARVSVIPMDYANQPALLTIIEDINDWMRAEELLRESQKLESLGLLAGGVAHDFNNLLVAMLGQSSLALFKLDEDDAASNHVRKVMRAAERAQDLTRQLLAYSGKGLFEVKAISINELIDDNMQLLRVAIPQRVSLHMDLGSDLALIEADVGQMQQIVMNLLLNAADAFNDDGGQITVRTRNDVITAEPDYDYHYPALSAGSRCVVIEVQDNGPGMTEETKHKIFDPFFSTKESGHGLGLAAVLGIVRGHQGAIRVITEPGAGTNFQIWLPAADSPTLLAESRPAGTTE